MHWWFLPLRDEDVLVTGERVLYRRRRHWASVATEFWQFAAVLFLRMAIGMRDAHGLGTVLLFGTAISLVILKPLVSGRRRVDGWATRELLAAVVFGFWAFSSDISPMGFADLVVVAMFGRFVVRVLRWAFFQRTYLTDRRLMEVDGFFGVKVNSMPLATVTDFMLCRTPVGEVLGYGTFRVESAGQEQALGNMQYLLEPEEFHDLVVSSPAWR